MVDVEVNVRRDDEEVVEDDCGEMTVKVPLDTEQRTDTRDASLTEIDEVSSAGVLAPLLPLPLDVPDVRRMPALSRGPYASFPLTPFWCMPALYPIPPTAVPGP